MTSVWSLVHAGRLRPAFDDDHSEHPGGHVVHEVAVESPLARCVDLDFGEYCGARGDADCVLEGVPLAVAVVEDGPHAVQLGRESCRERVWEFCRCSVGAGYNKKKKQI